MFLNQHTREATTEETKDVCRSPPPEETRRPSRLCIGDLGSLMQLLLSPLMPTVKASDTVGNRRRQTTTVVWIFKEKRSETFDAPSTTVPARSAAGGLRRDSELARSAVLRPQDVSVSCWSGHFN